MKDYEMETGGKEEQAMETQLPEKKERQAENQLYAANRT